MVYAGSDKVTVTNKFKYFTQKGILSGESLQSTNEWPVLSKALETGELLKDIDINKLAEIAKIIENGGAGSPGFNVRDIISGENFTVDGGSTLPPNAAPTLTSSFVPVTIDDKTTLTIPFTITDDKSTSLTLTETVDGVSTTKIVNLGSNTWTVGLLAAGTHTLSLKVSDNEGLESNVLMFSITVTAQISNISVIGVTLNQNNLTITKGNTSQLTATVLPSNATNKTVTWNSSNTTIATVNSSGLVTAIAAGSAVITATTTDGGFVANCNLTVKEAVVTPPPQTEAPIYEEGGYLNIPLNTHVWSGVSGYADTEYIGVAGGILSALFDRTTTGGNPIIVEGYPYVPFVVNMPTATYPYEASTIASSGSQLGKPILKVSTTHGTTATLIADYLKNAGKRMKLKLATGFKILSITPNVSNVTTRTSGVTADFEYVKFTLGGSIGDYVPPTTQDTFYSSIGKVIAANDYVFSRTFANIRVNADGTVEMLLPKGTLSSLDVAGVSAYLTSANLKIYYV
ncbi:Ig domain-containing protein [Bacillus sp. ISL-78]|nr:Ig domain-containing protein [Bacillus sp. ISL-78]MBT2629373.1 Ig domain-containing protein [Bacillus sp. ISL-101]